MTTGVRFGVAAALVLVVTLAGCGSATGGCLGSGSAVKVSVVADPPVDATVTNSTAVRYVELDHEPLDEVLTRVVESGEAARVGLEGRATCRLDDALAELPRHDGDRGGYYLRHDGSVVRVVMLFET